MAKTVEEVMNRELFSVRPDDSSDEVLGYLLSLGLSAAPVLDPYGKPVGFISLRDILSRHQPVVRDCMSSPPISIRTHHTVDDVARSLAERNLHHAAVVDDDDHAVGVVSVLDVVKALVGAPVSHPPAFPHYDRETGLVWSDDTVLRLESADTAPDGPGVLALVVGGAGRREIVAWAEACENVRTRVYELLSAPQDDKPVLAGILREKDVRFRTASVPDYKKRNEALKQLIGEMGRLLEPRTAAE